VPEPAAQLRTGGHILGPFVQAKPGLAHATGPQSFDQYPVTVGRGKGGS
jgi:hypothetical protein